MITRTRCQTSWPRTYVTYFQELAPPFRRAERVRVLRVGKIGFVWGRWTSKAADEQEAILEALSGRQVDLLDDDGHLLPTFHAVQGEEI